MSIYKFTEELNDLMDYFILADPFTLLDYKKKNNLPNDLITNFTTTEYGDEVVRGGTMIALSGVQNYPYTIYFNLTGKDIYGFQLSYVPTNHLFPISILIFFLAEKFTPENQLLFKIVFFLHCIYFLFGLTALSSSTTTWGDGAAPFGIFIVSNSILFVNYCVVRIENRNLLVISKLVFGLLGIVVILFSTNGLNHREYDGELVDFRRMIAFCACISYTFEAWILYIFKKEVEKKIF